jgi:hypothetical protein
MLTPITIEYLSTPQRDGGRPTVTQQVEARVFWDESVKTELFTRRYDETIEARVILLFQSDIPSIKPGRCHIRKNGELYCIQDMMHPLADIGLEGTIELLVSKGSEKV